MIYLDNAASTRLHDSVLEAMLPYMRQRWGNPSSIHREGRRARKAVERARRQVAALINAEPDEIVFTSGGTEANNMALSGSPGHIVTTAIEHDSVLEVCRSMEYPCTYVRPDNAGLIDAGDIASAITADTTLVSVMTANNEVGTIQDIRGIAEVCGDVPFHTDMVQAAGKIPLDVGKWDIGMASISAHKIGGPKGVGALYVGRDIPLRPGIRGGGQERGRRAGTENVPGIVGFGRACELALENMTANTSHVYTLRKRLLDAISRIPHTRLNGHPARRLPGNIHAAFLGVRGEDLIIKLDENNIAASTGSACSVHTQRESHVLRAMGLPPEVISGSLRLTLGPDNTISEMDHVASVLPGIVAGLRAVSPLKARYGF